jgi:hypothetical protein
MALILFWKFEILLYNSTSVRPFNHHTKDYIPTANRSDIKRIASKHIRVMS